MPLHMAVWAEYLDRHGIDPAGFEKRMHGSRNDALVRSLFGDGLSAAEVLRHGAAKEALWRERMAPQLLTRIVPGVTDFLDRHAPVPKAVGSNAEPANIGFVLDGAGLRRHFRAIVDGDQVANAKPHPDIYLKAARLLGAKPSECIVFEDSPTGVAAGKAAGMRVVGVNTARLERLSGADILIEDFQSPELVRWLSMQTPGTR